MPKCNAGPELAGVTVRDNRVLTAGTPRGLFLGLGKAAPAQPPGKQVAKDRREG